MPSKNTHTQPTKNTKKIQKKTTKTDSKMQLQKTLILQGKQNIAFYAGKTYNSEGAECEK